MLRHIAATIAIAVPVGLLSSCGQPPATDAPASEATVVPAEDTAAATEESAAPAGTDSREDKAVAVVDHLVAGDFAPVIAEFDATMTAAMPESLLATTMTQLEGQVGAFKERTGVTETQEDGYDVVRVICVFERATLTAKVVYNSQGQIAGLFFLPA